jgi:putative ATP-dependent endonuclease of OLD family
VTANYSVFSVGWASVGIFLNEQTFEVSVANSPDLLSALLDVLEEQGFGPKRTARIASWRSGQAQVDPEQLLAMVSDIGKGRLSSKLAKRLPGLKPPPYISSAIQFVASYVQSS